MRGAQEAADGIAAAEALDTTVTVTVALYGNEGRTRATDVRDTAGVAGRRSGEVRARLRGDEAPFDLRPILWVAMLLVTVPGVAVWVAGVAGLGRAAVPVGMFVAMLLVGLAATAPRRGHLPDPTT
jgi:hypothetical protein